MATSTASPGASNGQQRIIHIYIDNSNLWIQGHKTYAETKHPGAYDPTWRFDVGRLKRILTENSKLRVDAKNYEVKVHLYGSSPPPVDTVWEAIKSHDVDVSSWSGREKRVDIEMGIQIARQSLKDVHSGLQSEFVIVSGDRCLCSAVSKIAKDGFPVHVWSWSTCLAKEYQQKEHKLIKVYVLDAYLKEIGFRETTFRVDRGTINPHSIVILEPLSKADEINSFVSGLSVSVHRYECSTQREDAYSKDLVIIPTFAQSIKHTELGTLFTKAKSKLEPSGLSVMMYSHYCQRFFEDSHTQELAISNRFPELPHSALPDPKHESQESDYEDIDDNDGFTKVNCPSVQRKKKLKRDEQRSRHHCYWGVYCSQGINCKYGHTKNEEQHFKTYGHKIPTRYTHTHTQFITPGGGAERAS